MRASAVVTGSIARRQWDSRLMSEVGEEKIVAARRSVMCVLRHVQDLVDLNIGGSLLVGL